MSDDVDRATALIEQDTERAIAAARVPVPDGVSGECDGCFEEMGRLIGGLCGFCRDGRKRP
jgi:hypothetical protein